MALEAEPEAAELEPLAVEAAAAVPEAEAEPEAEALEPLDAPFARAAAQTDFTPALISVEGQLSACLGSGFSDLRSTSPVVQVDFNKQGVTSFVMVSLPVVHWQ